MRDQSSVIPPETRARWAALAEDHPYVDQQDGGCVTCWTLASEAVPRLLAALADAEDRARTVRASHVPGCEGHDVDVLGAECIVAALAEGSTVELLAPRRRDPEGPAWVREGA